MAGFLDSSMLCNMIAQSLLNHARQNPRIEIFTDLTKLKKSTRTVHCISTYTVSAGTPDLCTGWHCYLGHPVIPVLTPARRCQHLQCTERSDARPINGWPQSDQPFQDRLSLYFKDKINCVLILLIKYFISHKLALYVYFKMRAYNFFILSFAVSALQIQIE